MDGSIKTNKNVSAKFIPRHETKSTLDTLFLSNGEIATASDADQIRVGDDSTGGRIVFDASDISIGTAWKTYEGSLPVFGESPHITCGNGVYLSVDDDNDLYRSTDGLKWDVVDTGLLLFTAGEND